MDLHELYPHELPPHRSAGARALVILHERHLREFFPVWERARKAGLTLPATADPAYASFETLLRHVLGAARGYVVWICEQVGLSDPGIRAAPAPERIALEARDYLDEVLAGWRGALAELPDDRMEDRTYPSRWTIPYSIDAMLEHAVMHPIRHTFQLESLLAGRKR